MTLYKFIKASEDNLPEDFIAVRFKYPNSDIWFYHDPKQKAYIKMLFDQKNCEVEFLQPVTIPDDWEEEFKRFYYRSAYFTDRNVADWIKSNLLAEAEYPNDPYYQQEIDCLRKGFIKGYRSASKPKDNELRECEHCGSKWKSVERCPECYPI